MILSFYIFTAIFRFCLILRSVEVGTNTRLCLCFFLHFACALAATEQSTGKASLFVKYEKVLNLDPSPTITFFDIMVIVIICDVSEVSHYSGHKKSYTH